MSETTEESPDKFFVIGDKSDTDKRFYINGSSGHVGINKIPTTDDTLCVNGNVKTDNLTVNTSATIGNGTFGFSGDNNIIGIKNKNLSDDATDYAIKQTNQGETSVNSSSSKDILLCNNNTTKMIIKNTGNVGIGTTSPESILHIVEQNGTAAANNGGTISGTIILDHEDHGGQSSIVFRSGVNRTSDYGYISYQDDHSDRSGYESSVLTIGAQNDSTGGHQDNIALMSSGNVGIGTTTPQYKLDVVGDINFTGDITKNGIMWGIPTGGIIMWSGAVSNIPNGWVICNGVPPTPDLRGKFILGGGGEYNVGNTGGSNSITLSGDNLPSHNHTVTIYHSGEHSHVLNTLNDDENLYGGDRGGPSFGKNDSNDVTSWGHIIASAGRHNHTGSIGHTGGSVPFDNKPEYYALAYIMKT